MEDKELEKILQRKMKAYMEQLMKQMEEKKKEEDKKDVYEKVKPLFTDDGYKHLIKIREANTEVADKILATIIQLIYMGMLRSKADYIIVEKLRRKIVGESGKIYVYRKGEMKDLGEALTDDE